MNFMGKHILALVRARDILFTWTVREVKVRYTDTSLGLAWIVLYPADLSLCRSRVCHTLSL
jgi:ABC-type polysaccharide/polyol phosphate export permease